MKYSLLFFCLISVGLVQAQPTLTAISNPEANVHYWYVPASTTPTLGSGGAHVTWNFSSLSAGAVELFPNPASDLLQIRFATSGATDVRISLTDMLGRPA